MRRLKLGVVGAGAWGKNHVRTAAGLAEAELAAVCDTDPSLRERLARQYPATHITGDVGDLLGRVEAVIVASPAATHARLALQCLEAGKPCLVEKPFALNVPDAQAVARRSAECRAPVVAGHLLVFHPAVERLRRLRLHGGAKQYHHDEVGTNSRLDALQAAVLLAKLPHLAAWSAKRREHAAYYTDGLAGLPQVKTPVVDACNEHIFHQYTLRVERRDELQAHLKSREIGSAVYYPVPLHLQNCFRDLGYGRGRLPESERAAAEAISLPVYPELTRGQLDYVIDAIRGFYR